MTKPIGSFALLVCLALTAQLAFADSLVLSVTADTTFTGNAGFIINEVFTPGSDPVEIADIGAFPENGKLRLYAFRDPGGAWDIAPAAGYLVQLSSLNVGDSWAGLPSEELGPVTNRVEAQESVIVPAGTFNNAYRVAVRADNLPGSSDPIEEFWFVEGVGFVLNIGYRLDGTVEYTTELISFTGSGSGFFPSSVGNVWEYDETPGGVSAVDDADLPTTAILIGAYPNPFNPTTRLAFDMAAPGMASLKIYDPAGRLVTSLVDEYRGAGRHEVVWNGRDQAGRMSSAGVYLYRFESGAYSRTMRVTLVK